MTRIEPQKGKAYDNLPKKELGAFNLKEYVVSTKYDGNQIFIIKEGSSVRYFTSDYKEFKLKQQIDDILLLNTNDFILVCEFMYDSVGRLGDRRYSAILTTLRTNFNKGLTNISLRLEKINIKAFDYINLSDTQNLVGSNGELLKYTMPYNHRLDAATYLELPDQISIITFQTMTGFEAMIRAASLVRDGWEGCMAVEPSSHYFIGKRVNHSIKLKVRKTVDLRCIAVTQGIGKYTGMIGSLVLQDKKGRVVSVGSGLEDYQRALKPEYFIGEIVEIEYEQILDTYIQPTFTRVRDDKVESD
jgi:ATP-dependent DNA ligase